MNTWCHCEANEVKRHPRAVTRPPATASSLVDFLLHTEMIRGESRSDTEEESAPSHWVWAEPASEVREPRREKWARLWRKMMARESWRPCAMMLTRIEARATHQPQPPSG